MKKIIPFLAIVALIACNSKKSETSGDGDITGKWKAQSMYSQGKVFSQSNRDSVFQLMMAEGKRSALEIDNDFSAEDSLAEAEENNLYLDRILNLQYDMQKDGALIMSVGNTGDSNTITFTGKYTYDKKTNDLTITLDSAVNNKVTTVKTTIKDGVMEMEFNAETKYVMTKVN